MSLRRAVLVNRPDTLRFALFARTSDWLLESRAEATETDPEFARWRTPGGLRVTLTQNPLLQHPVGQLRASH